MHSFFSLFILSCRYAGSVRDLFSNIQVQSGRAIASGFHIHIHGNTQADPIHEEKQRKFKAAQRALSLIPLGSTVSFAEMLWLEKEGSARL